MAKDKGPASRTETRPSETANGRIDRELTAAGDRDAVARGAAAAKKNYAETLSRALAQRIADTLRNSFPGILPDPDGAGQESRARTGKGMKKLDVNYSTVELGLGLGVSIKTINFRDARTRRYTKNYTRVDNELRAEAADYHERQPYAVLCALVFLPLDACDDGGSTHPSSFGQSVRIFRFRSGREKPADDPTLFERILIGLYDTDPANFGEVGFFDAGDDPPRLGKPRDLLTLGEAMRAIIESYESRNKSKFRWADGTTEIVTSPDVETGEDDEL